MVETVGGPMSYSALWKNLSNLHLQQLFLLSALSKNPSFGWRIHCCLVLDVFANSKGLMEISVRKMVVLNRIPLVWFLPNTLKERTGTITSAKAPIVILGCRFWGKKWIDVYSFSTVTLVSKCFMSVWFDRNWDLSLLFFRLLTARCLWRAGEVSHTGVTLLNSFFSLLFPWVQYKLTPKWTDPGSDVQSFIKCINSIMKATSEQPWQMHLGRILQCENGTITPSTFYSLWKDELIFIVKCN